MQITLNGGSSTFQLTGDAATTKAADFVLSSGNTVVTIDTSSGHSPASTFGLKFGGAEREVYQ